MKYRGLFLSAAVAALAFCSGCGGGGGSSGPSWQVTGLSQNTSSNLNGGDTVTITGSGFNAVQVLKVLFGGQPGLSMNVVDDSHVTVLTPPSPTGGAVTVDVDVVSLDGGTIRLPGAYTYVDPNAAPQPSTITPTSFSPTGAESFTIQGTNFGTAGGTVQVTFEGVGTVSGTVGGNGTIVTGRAAVSAGVPPVGTIHVSVTRGTKSGTVPTLVSYSWTQPLPAGVPSQAAGGASRPVRLDENDAVFCLAGQNGTWGDADDEVAIFSVSPANHLLPVRRTGNVPIGYLDPQNSVVAVLAPGSVVVASTGQDGVLGTADDKIVKIDGLPAAPVVTDIPTGVLNVAPVAVVGPNEMAYCTAGGDGLLGTNDDILFVITYPGPTGAAMSVGNGGVDASGPASLSIPQSADGGNSVWLLTIGADGTPGTSDDRVVRAALPTLNPVSAAAPSPGQPLLVLDANSAAAVGAGADKTLGTTDDVLDAFQFGGTSITAQTKMLGGAVNVGSLLPAVRLGGGGLVVAAGAGYIVFPSLGTANPPTPFNGAPLLAELPGGNGVVVFGPGADLIAGLAPDAALLLSPGAPQQSFSQALPWPQTVVPGTDATRAFAVGAGQDAVFNTGDEVLQVTVAPAAGAATDASILPLSSTGALIVPVPAGRTFVPIGAHWGLVQLPGADGVFGTMDDLLLVAHF